MELEGKTGIVTGSGRGIGAGIATAFGREGANVVVMDLNFEDAQGVAKSIESSGGSALAVEASVTDKASLDAMVTQTLERFGTIDILVNNAGIESTPRMLTDVSEEQWDRVLEVNLKGAFLCCQAVLPAMMERREGRIVNIASLAGRRMSFFGSADYTASKHGMVGLASHLAWEVADYGITVNTVCPGAVLTPGLVDGTTPEYRDFVTKRMIPLGRWCTPDDIAQAVVFFAGDRAALVTGEVLDVDGGVMTGYGEDLRPIVRQRMAEMQQAAAGRH